MPSEIKDNFWDFGLYYYAKSLILSYTDIDTRASLACVSHDFSDQLILDKLNEEVYPKDKLTEHRRLRQLMSVLSHYHNLNYLNRAWPNSIFLPELNSEQYAKLIEQIEHFPADVSKLVRIDQSQLLKAKFIFDTFASENLNGAIRSKNKAMLGLLLANRFVNGTMTSLWYSEFQQSAMHRRYILMSILNGLFSIVVHWGLVELYNFGVFSFLVKFGEYCLSFDNYIISLMDSSWLFLIIIGGLSILSGIPLYGMGSLLYLVFLALIYGLGLFVKDSILYYLFLPSTSYYSFIIDSFKSCFVTGIIMVCSICVIIGVFDFFFPINLVVFVLGLLLNDFRRIMFDNNIAPISPIFQKILLSFPVTIIYASLGLPLVVLASAVIHLKALVEVILYSIAFIFLSVIWGATYLLSIRNDSYQNAVGNDFYSLFAHDVFSFYSSSHEWIFGKLQLILAPKYNWVQSTSSFSESNFRNHPESESMLNLARNVSIAESVEAKTFTPKEQVTFILKEYLKKHSGVLSFFKADTKDTVFLRSLLNDILVLSIAEIDFKMEEYKNKTSKSSLSEEFIALADYVQHVLLPMEERETYRENPSLEALYKRVPLLRRTDALRDFTLPTSYPTAA